MSSSGRHAGMWTGTKGSVNETVSNKDVLTVSQRKAIVRAENNINDHLNEEHFLAAERDLKNDPIIGKNGKIYNHLQEVEQAINALKSSKQSIEGSLKNPKLGQRSKRLLEKALRKIDKCLARWDKIKGENKK